MDYKVENLKDSTYQVVSYEIDTSPGTYLEESIRTVWYQGSLSDCNAWLQLNDKGYF